MCYCSCFSLLHSLSSKRLSSYGLLPFSPPWWWVEGGGCCLLAGNNSWWGETCGELENVCLSVICPIYVLIRLLIWFNLTICIYLTFEFFQSKVNGLNLLVAPYQACENSGMFSGVNPLNISNRTSKDRLTCSVGQVILPWEQRVSQVVVRRHDALGRWGSRSVHFSLSFPISVSTNSPVLLPVPVVGWLVAYSGGFALVLAGMLMQDVQGFGVCGCLGDSRASARFVAAVFTSGYFTSIWGKRIASR